MLYTQFTFRPTCHRTSTHAARELSIGTVGDFTANRGKKQSCVRLFVRQPPEHSSILTKALPRALTFWDLSHFGRFGVKDSLSFDMIFRTKHRRRRLDISITIASLKARKRSFLCIWHNDAAFSPTSVPRPFFPVFNMHLARCFMYILSRDLPNFFMFNFFQCNM